MKYSEQDILSLHYRCFFELPDDDWRTILQWGVSPFEAWESFFGAPFKSFSLNDDEREKLRTLSKLYVAACGLEDLAFVKKFPSLAILDLSFNPVKLNDDNQIDGIDTVGLAGCDLDNDALPYIKNCQELFLGENNLSAFNEILQCNPSLRSLDVSNNDFEIINGTSTHTELVSLDCSMNSLSDASGLANIPHLQEVYLNNNLLENVDFLFSLPELKTVSISWNKFSQQYLTQLRNRLSELKIEVEED